VFAGKDASRGFAKSSVKNEDAVPEWSDLGPKEQKSLEDW
jgi:membrane-associated progesterone receptor component